MSLFGEMLRVLSDPGVPMPACHEAVWKCLACGREGCACRLVDGRFTAATNYCAPCENGRILRRLQAQREDNAREDGAPGGEENGR